MYLKRCKPVKMYWTHKAYTTSPPTPNKNKNKQKGYRDNMQRCVLQVVQAYIKCMLESVEAVVASDVSGWG